MDVLSPDEIASLALHAFEIYRALLSPPPTRLGHEAGKVADGATGHTPTHKTPVV